jgi:hypothetical protein
MSATRQRLGQTLNADRIASETIWRIKRCHHAKAQTAHRQFGYLEILVSGLGGYSVQADVRHQIADRLPQLGSQQTLDLFRRRMSFCQPEFFTKGLFGIAQPLNKPHRVRALRTMGAVAVREKRMAGLRKMSYDLTHNISMI